ncbi:EF-hand domain-containing protein [archaeon]|nr:MAG: EF-hand domain-containing protein [archaeon]
MLQQGVVPVLEKALHKHTGFSHQAIREKALYALGYLSLLDNLRAGLCTNSILKGVQHEFHHGTLSEQTTILQLLMSVHNRYPQEREVVLDLRDDILKLVKTGPWHARNLVIKVICVLYGDNEDKWYLMEKGLVEAIIEVIEAKTVDLQEAPVVIFLHLSTHPDIPEVLLNKGVARVAARLVDAEDPIIRELAVVLLRVLQVYDKHTVMDSLPENKQYLLKRDEFNPQLYGGEYGGMIEEYLQLIVENRRNQGYLVQQFSSEELEEYNISKGQIESFQNTFMELDAECKGYLGVDELKMLIVMMGEVMDVEEIDLLLKEYDTDHSGNLDFREFVFMMLDWDRRFGTGWKRTYNQATKRGAVGKAMRRFKLWWEKDKVESAQIQQIKMRRQRQDEGYQALRMKYLPQEQMAAVREREMRMREIGIKANLQGERLPPVNPNQRL